MNLFLIGVFLLGGLVFALVVTTVCFSKAQTGIKVFYGVLSVLICCLLFGLWGFTFSVKKIAAPLIADNSAILCEQLEALYPGILIQQYYIEDITTLLDKIDLKGQLDTATADLGKIEKFVVMTALRSFTPLLYSSEALSGALQGLITDDMRAAGTVSLNQIIDVLEEKALSTLQKVIFIAQIVIAGLIVIYLIFSIIIGRSYKSPKSSSGRGISFGEDVDTK